MRNSTLLFLIKRSSDDVTEICLAMKKRGFGVGRWNGAGGKVEQGESIEEATLREVKEEIGVEAKDIKKIGELTFIFPHNPAWDQLVHAYFCESWEGEPTETEEMRPAWFSVDNIPHDAMWADDKFWLPKTIKGELVKGRFVFAEGDVVLTHSVEIVRSFIPLQ